jgi:hypothetical protein
LVHGWELSTIFTATSVGYGTATLPADVALSGEGAEIANIVALPGSYELDMNLARNFKVPRTDSQNVQFRWEVFNLTNEAIFTGSPAGSISGSTFGSFTTTGNPRIMQLALKYNF